MTPLKKFSHQFSCMTTKCEVQLYAKHAKDANKVAGLIEDNSRRLEKKYNFFSQDSLIAKLNNRTESTIEIDQETQQVLSFVKTLSIKTQGCFDITTGTLKQCAKLPTQKQIEDCRARLMPFTGPDKWALQDNKIHFLNTHVKIDLGGVIKEYAVDQAGKIAKQYNMSALINFGGDIYVNGDKPDGSAFSVAVKNPKDPTQNIAILKLRNQGLTTSAHYERSTVVEGKSYSHIINNTKNKPDANVQTILSATVISDSVLTSGIYSTSLMINPGLPVDKNINVVLVDEHLRLHQNIVASG